MFSPIVILLPISILIYILSIYILSRHITQSCYSINNRGVRIWYPCSNTYSVCTSDGRRPYFVHPI